MLYRSGDNLLYGATKFVEDNNDITLFSAYLRLNTLIYLNNTNNIKQIVVRWEIEDLVKKVSDFEDLYIYCKKKKIALYRNTRIHLKAFWDNNSSVLFGSANITGRGIGEKDNHNFELNGTVNDISFTDQNYLNKIILDSEYVSENLFNKLERIISNIEVPVEEFPKLPTPSPTVDYFLINQLPMSSSPELLYKIYTGEKSDLVDVKCASHDLELYNIERGLDKSDFDNSLKDKFNAHPFICAFKEAVKNNTDDRGRSDRNSTMNFGSVTRWFEDKTTTVPTPRRWELKKYVGILYDWICLFDNDFTWDTPRHTQVIYYRRES